MFLDKKAVLEIWRNPGLNLTIFRGTRPRRIEGMLIITVLWKPAIC